MTKRKQNAKTPRYEPSPSEIARACLEIQSEWTDQDRYSRLRGHGRHRDQGGFLLEVDRCVRVGAGVQIDPGVSEF